LDAHGRSADPADLSAERTTMVGELRLRQEVWAGWFGDHPD